MLFVIFPFHILSLSLIFVSLITMCLGMFLLGFILLGTLCESQSLNYWKVQVVSDSLQPMDCSLPGSSVHGILQARILEWVAIPFSRGSSHPRGQIQGSNPGLPHCRQILYHVSHQRSPKSTSSLWQKLYRWFIMLF